MPVIKNETMAPLHVVTPLEESLYKYSGTYLCTVIMHVESLLVISYCIVTQSVNIIVSVPTLKRA